MKITGIISNRISAVRGHVNAKKPPFPTNVSFKKRTDATADDSNISWGGILIAAAATFVAVSAAVLGIRKFLGKSAQSAGDFGKKFTHIPRRNLPEVSLKLDADKLRSLPLEVKRQAKAALNDAVSHADYQKVLRDFNIGM